LPDCFIPARYQGIVFALMPHTRLSFARLLPIVSVLWGLPACGGFAQSTASKALSIMPGVINRVENKSLRFAMLKYGLDEFCAQMTRSGAPVKLADDQPGIGRFFPARCESRVIDDENAKSFLVQFSGDGYAWTNVTGRIGFEAAGVMEYGPDFLLDGDAMYLYLQPRHVGSTSFAVKMIENPGANLALSVAPAQWADKFGQQLVSAQLRQGITVIRQSSGEVDVGFGIIEKGKRPFHPYLVKGEGKVVLANERIEVHSGQREFLGPFEVDSSGRALFFTVGIDGAEAVDVLLLARDAGNPWLASYVRTPQTTAPVYAPLMQDVVSAKGEWRRTVPLSKGIYYLVVDNTATAGRVAPPAGTFGDRAALANCVVQLGDAP
jgi:hypothetical protein